MENKKIFTDYLVKISKILDILNIKKNKIEISKNLIGSFLINFSRLLVTNEKTAPFLKDYTQASDANPEKLFDFLDSKRVDYHKILIQAQNETLQTFVKQMKSDLRSNKIEEINKIINE